MKPPRTRFVTLCGRIFRYADSAYFPSAAWRGRQLYFCAQVCLDAFQADPEAFYRAHRNSERAKGAIAPREPDHVE